MVKLNLQDWKATNKVFARLNNLHRWTSSFIAEDRYNELTKQGLNCMVAYMIALFCEEEGQQICWERFPKIAIFRAFQKAYIYYDITERNINGVCQKRENQKNDFDEITKNKIFSETKDNEFTEFICQGMDTYEMQIYRAATKIATLVELIENERFKMIDAEEYEKIKEQVSSYLEKFINIPGVMEMKDVNGKLFKLLRKISKSRNQNRWAGHPCKKKCSILGHGFDTAVFVYFISLERNPHDEKKATHNFFVGLFHDVPETWTGDFPSDVKRLIPDLRKAIKEYEEDVLESEMYVLLPDFISNKIRVLLKEEESPEFQKFYKPGDYFSADSECCRFYEDGTRGKYFFKDAMKTFQAQIDSGKYVLPPIAMQMHQYFYDYAEKIFNTL